MQNYSAKPKTQDEGNLPPRDPRQQNSSNQKPREEKRKQAKIIPFPERREKHDQQDREPGKR